MQPLWIIVWRFLINLKIELLHDPEVLLLGIYWGRTVLITISKTYLYPYDHCGIISNSQAVETS